MARPASRSSNPYQRGDIASICDLSVPILKNLEKGGVPRKRRRRGSGNPNPYDHDDALRFLVAKELRRVGLLVSSIHSVFASLDSPPSSGKPWVWLRTSEARNEGAALVLVLGHPMGPAPAHTGAAYLTTAAEAVKWLATKRTTIVVDVGALIQQLEERTGTRYDDQPADERARG